MLIEIWSDVVCPWCYLGYRRLRAALDELHREDELRLDDVELRWRAFQLDPGAPREPSDLRAAMDRKYGQGAFDSMTPRLTALGAEVGIDYRFDTALRVNTMDAHRLVAWAGTQGPVSVGGLQDSLVQVLFHDYFTAGADLCDQAVLVAAAKTVGLDVDLAAEVIASGAFADKVRADQAAAVDRSITGVPAFVLDGRWLIPGAQDTAQMVRLISRAGGKEQVGR